jgi:hypothetical protein
VRNRRTLIAADITDAGLQQRLGHSENPFAFELGACAQAQRLHFFGK